MDKVYLTRRSKQDVISFTATQDFDSRAMQVTKQQASIIADLEARHDILRTWMEQIYNLNTRAGHFVDVVFPKELEDVTKVKKSGRLKSRSKIGVRDGSSGDAATRGGVV